MTLRGAVLYTLIALVPIVFYRGTSEVFEFPKTELLATGALVLLGAFLSSEIARARAWGPRAWMRGLGGRVSESVKRDPLGGAVALFLLSAALSALRPLGASGVISTSSFAGCPAMTATTSTDLSVVNLTSASSLGR